MGAFAFTDEYLNRVGGLIAANLGDDGGRTVGLYKNDYTPVPGVAIGDLTEADFTGYARFSIGATAWLTGIVAHEEIITAPATASFTNTGASPQTVYGYFIYYDAEGELVWVQKFDTPQVVAPGVPLIFTPRQKDKAC